MKALDVLFSTHPIASLLIFFAGLVWLAIYVATHKSRDNDIAAVELAPVRFDRASADKKYGVR